MEELHDMDLINNLTAFPDNCDYNLGPHGGTDETSSTQLFSDISKIEDDDVFSDYPDFYKSSLELGLQHADDPKELAELRSSLDSPLQHNLPNQHNFAPDILESTQSYHRYSPDSLLPSPTIRTDNPKAPLTPISNFRASTSNTRMVHKVVPKTRKTKNKKSAADFKTLVFALDLPSSSTLDSHLLSQSYSTTKPRAGKRRGLINVGMACTQCTSRHQECSNDVVCKRCKDLCKRGAHSFSISPCIRPKAQPLNELNVFISGFMSMKTADALTPANFSDTLTRALLKLATKATCDILGGNQLEELIKMGESRLGGTHLRACALFTLASYAPYPRLKVDGPALESKRQHRSSHASSMIGHDKDNTNDAGDDIFWSNIRAVTSRHVFNWIDATMRRWHDLCGDRDNLVVMLGTLADVYRSLLDVSNIYTQNSAFPALTSSSHSSFCSQQSILQARILHYLQWTSTQVFPPSSPIHAKLFPQGLLDSDALRKVCLSPDFLGTLWSQWGTFTSPESWELCASVEKFEKGLVENYRASEQVFGEPEGVR